ncbi:hypothetical protein IWW38_005290, partial [Coemansia aciculifera]
MSKQTRRNTLRRKQRPATPPPDDKAQASERPVRRGNTLIRRRWSNDPRETPAPVVKPQQPAKEEQPPPRRQHRSRRHSNESSHAPKLAPDTSDVWIRRTIKDRLSLSSVNPRLLLSGIKPPHIFQMLAGHVKEEKAPPPPPPPPPRRKRSPHKHKHRHRNRSPGGTPIRSTPRTPPADAGAKTREHEQVAYAMPTPTHIIIPNEVLQQSDHQGADLQLYEIDPTQQQQQQQGSDPVPQGLCSIVASRAIPLACIDRKHRLSTASGDDDSSGSNVVRVLKVLGRMNSSTDISANVAQSSPMLVTVARNGSITSEASLLPRR